MIRVLFFLLLVYNTAYSQVDLKKGLRAHYPYDGNFNDVSGNNNNPFYNNATLTADRFGKANSAVHFNGKDQYIRIPNYPSLNTKDQITISVWVRPTGFYRDICHASSIVTKGGGNYEPGDYALRFDDALFTNGTGCSDTIPDEIHQNFRGTGTALIAYSPLIVKNEWYAVTYTNDGKTARLYVNCELKYSVPFHETFSNHHDLYIGRTNDEFFNFWMNGDLDDLRIYDRALNADEINALCGKKAEVKKPEVKLEQRKTELMQELEVEHNEVSITLYDNGTVDGDSITLVYNDSIITTHKLLTEQPLTYVIKIAPGAARNELLMYAENMGSIPPNTAMMIIYDGNKRHEVSIRSSDKTSGMVKFKLLE
jgi:hypothetical protein